MYIDCIFTVYDVYDIIVKMNGGIILSSISKETYMQVMQKTIPLVVTALGTTTALHQSIDELYAKRPQEYYNAFREGLCDLINNRMFQYHSFQHTLYLEKVGGIVEYAYKTGNFLEVHRLIKRGYPSVYKLVMHSSNLSYDRVSIAVRGGGKKDYLPEQYHYNSIYLMFFLVFLEEATTNRKFQFDHTQWFMQIQRSTDFHEDNLQLFDAHQKEIDVPRKAIRFEGILDTYRESTSVEMLLDTLIDDEHHATFYPNFKGDLYDSYPMEVLDASRDKLFTVGGNSAYIGVLSHFLKTYGIFENSFSLELTTRDFVNMQTVLDKVFKNSKVDIDKDLMSITMIYLAVLAKEINLAKPLAARSSKEYQEFEERLNVSKEVDSLQERVQQLEAENEALQKEVNEKSAVLQEVALKSREVDTQKKKLELQLVEASEDKQELHRLRQLFFLQNDVDIEDSNLHVQDRAEKMTQELQQYKILVVGGHDNWVEKMKALFPNWVFLTVEGANNRQLKHTQFDFLLFNIIKNNHGAYYRIQQLISKDKMLYANHVNIPRSIENIYAQINE